MMNYGLEKLSTRPPPPVRLPVKAVMVMTTFLSHLLLLERVGRAFSAHPFTNLAPWSVGFILMSALSIGILIAMDRALLWKWVCQKSYLAFSLVFALAAILPGSIGFFVGMEGLW